MHIEARIQTMPPEAHEVEKGKPFLCLIPPGYLATERDATTKKVVEVASEPVMLLGKKFWLTKGSVVWEARNGFSTPREALIFRNEAGAAVGLAYLHMGDYFRVFVRQDPKDNYGKIYTAELRVLAGEAKK